MTNPNSPLSIRKATPHDVKVIRHIAHETWPVAYASILSDEALQYMLQYFYSVDALTGQMETGQQFFLAELLEESIGFGSVTEIAPQVYKLNKLYVLPSRQKTGAGKALLNFAIDLARDNNGKQLILNVNRNNPAIGFYERMGFTILKEEDIDLGNGVVQEDYVMGCTLNDEKITAGKE